MPLSAALVYNASPEELSKIRFPPGTGIHYGGRIPGSKITRGSTALYTVRFAIGLFGQMMPSLKTNFANASIDW